MKKRRISGLPRFLVCSSSEEDGFQFKENHGFSNDGSAVHAAIKLHGMGQEVDLAEICREYHADFDEVEFLFGRGKEAWKSLLPYFTNCRFELRVETSLTIGTLDVAHHDGVTAAVVDWKSGYSRTNYRDQVLGYAHALVEEFGMPESGYVSCGVSWLRYRETEIFNADAATLEAFAKRVGQQNKLVGKQYAPSEHCTYCPRQLECQARTAYLQSTAQSLTVACDDPLSRAVDLGALYPRVKMLKKAVERFEDALRIEVARLGQVPIGDGKALQFVEHKKDKLNARTTFELLAVEGPLAMNDLFGAMTISKTKLLDAAANKATGTKKAAKEALLNSLRHAGAVETSHEQWLEMTEEKKDE